MADDPVSSNAPSLKEPFNAAAMTPAQREALEVAQEVRRMDGAATERQLDHQPAHGLQDGPTITMIGAANVRLAAFNARQNNVNDNAQNRNDQAEQQARARALLEEHKKTTMSDEFNEKAHDDRSL